MKGHPMFEVDTKGLAKLIEDQGPSRLIAELIANGLDEDGVRNIRIVVSPVEKRPLVFVSVEDDAPNGFSDLSHAYTVFGESYKKGKSEKAGRFNLGDKLFVAAAVNTGEIARINTTTGGIAFSLLNGRCKTTDRRAIGSEVSGYLKATRSEYEAEIIPFLRSLLLPEGINVTLNGQKLPARTPVHEFKATLPTVLADSEGVLRPTKRETTIRVFDPLPDEKASIYELGMPVVDTGDRWHYDIRQKVPLGLQRDNVTPAYLRLVRALVLNEMHSRIKPEEASNAWVREATSSKVVVPAAVETVLNHRFGEKRVVYDPSDPEANNNAVANGYNVIHGRSLNKEEWENVKTKAPVASAGAAFPTAKPYSDDPSAPLVEVLPESEWTQGIATVVNFSKWLHWQLFGVKLEVKVLNHASGLKANFLAAYARGSLDLNPAKLGDWFFNGFSSSSSDKVLELLIHEFGHWYSPNHLSEEYHEGLCKIGAKLAAILIWDLADFDFVQNIDVLMGKEGNQ